MKNIFKVAQQKVHRRTENCAAWVRIVGICGNTAKGGEATKIAQLRFNQGKKG